MITPRRFAAGLAVVAIFLGGGGIAHALTATWTGASSNNWGTSGNWSWSGTCTACVPGGAGGASGADVVISSGTVVVNTSATNLATISISGGTITVSGASVLTTSGNFALTGGTFTGGSGALTVNGSLSSINNNNVGLVGHWKLDETASPAEDALSTNDLTWNGGPTASTSVPTVGFNDTRSLSMSGAQYATSAALNGIAALEPTTVTMSAWFKATSVDTSGSEIVSGGNTYALRITSAGFTVIKRIHNGAARDWVEYQVTASNVLDGGWHHIVGIIPNGGAMRAHLDGSLVSGTYYLNGTSGQQLVASPPEISVIDYSGVGTYGLNLGRNPSNTAYDFGAGCTAGDCAIDDVRLFNTALTAGEVATLSAGTQPGTLTLTGPATVAGNVTVNADGTLALVGGAASLSIGSGRTLTLDGTLNASSSTSSRPTIKSSAGTYAFNVGSVNGATPTLNISSLAVQNTDANGMRINGAGAANTTATTTFVSFDNIAFNNGATSAGSAYLRIYASTLYLTANGCTFGVGEASGALPASAVRLAGNGTSGGETRAVFGNATCATSKTDGTTSLCVTSWKSDDDLDENGIGNTSASDGAVVQFSRAAGSDFGGTIEGFPVAAFDWTTFAYYSTYIVYHDADPTGTKDRIYVRAADGSVISASYYWEAPAGERIVGSPRYVTSGSTHYIYVALASGKIYRLVDNSTAKTLTLASGWSSNPVSLGTPSTITTPLALDASNIYVGGTLSGNQRLWTVSQSAGTFGTPFAITPTITAAAPLLWTNGGISYVILGLSGDLFEINVTNQMSWNDNTNPAGSVLGRINMGTRTQKTVFAGDSNGTLWAIDPANFSGTAKRWSVAAGSAVGSTFYDYATDSVMFGTTGGSVYALAATTGATFTTTGWPFDPDSTTTDPISAPPLYVNGILVVGTTTGKLFFIDRATGSLAPCSGPSLIREYYFGSGVSVSGVSYNTTVSRYMVSTSSSANDGRLYYFDNINDLTACR